MWITRGDVETDPSRVSLSKGIEELAKDCPALYEYLTLNRFPDGGERQVATLVLFIEEGRWKGCLSDRETDRTLWKVGDTLGDLLLSMDQEIQEGSAGWRRSSRPKAMPRKK
jgi:hypothetical protein